MAQFLSRFQLVFALWSIRFMFYRNYNAGRRWLCAQQNTFVGGNNGIKTV